MEGEGEPGDGRKSNEGTPHLQGSPDSPRTPSKSLGSSSASRLAILVAWDPSVGSGGRDGQGNINSSGTHKAEEETPLEPFIPEPEYEHQQSEFTGPSPATAEEEQHDAASVSSTGSWEANAAVSLAIPDFTPEMIQGPAWPLPTAVVQEPVAFATTSLPSPTNANAGGGFSSSTSPSKRDMGSVTAEVCNVEDFGHGNQLQDGPHLPAHSPSQVEVVVTPNVVGPEPAPTASPPLPMGLPPLAPKPQVMTQVEHFLADDDDSDSAVGSPSRSGPGSFGRRGHDDSTVTAEFRRTPPEVGPGSWTVPNPLLIRNESNPTMLERFNSWKSVDTPLGHQRGSRLPMHAGIGMHLINSPSESFLLGAMTENRDGVHQEGADAAKSGGRVDSGSRVPLKTTLFLITAMLTVLGIFAVLVVAASPWRAETATLPVSDLSSSTCPLGSNAAIYNGAPQDLSAWENILDNSIERFNIELLGSIEQASYAAEIALLLDGIQPPSIQSLAQRALVTALVNRTLTSTPTGDSFPITDWSLLWCQLNRSASSTSIVSCLPLLNEPGTAPISSWSNAAARIETAVQRARSSCADSAPSYLHVLAGLDCQGAASSSSLIRLVSFRSGSVGGCNTGTLTTLANEGFVVLATTVNANGWLSQGGLLSVSCPARSDLDSFSAVTIGLVSRLVQPTGSVSLSVARSVEALTPALRVTASLRALSAWMLQEVPLESRPVDFFAEVEVAPLIIFILLVWGLCMIFAGLQWRAALAPILMGLFRIRQFDAVLGKIDTLNEDTMDKFLLTSQDWRLLTTGAKKLANEEGDHNRPLKDRSSKQQSPVDGPLTVPESSQATVSVAVPVPPLHSHPVARRPSHTSKPLHGDEVQRVLLNVTEPELLLLRLHAATLHVLLYRRYLPASLLVPATQEFFEKDDEDVDLGEYAAVSLFLPGGYTGNEKAAVSGSVSPRSSPGGTPPTTSIFSKPTAASASASPPAAPLLWMTPPTALSAVTGSPETQHAVAMEATQLPPSAFSVSMFQAFRSPVTSTFSPPPTSEDGSPSPGKNPRERDAASTSGGLPVPPPLELPNNMDPHGTPPGSPLPLQKRPRRMNSTASFSVGDLGVLPVHTGANAAHGEGLFSLHRKKLTCLVVRMYIGENSLDAPVNSAGWEGAADPNKIPVSAVTALTEAFHDVVATCAKQFDGVLCRIELFGATLLWNAFAPYPFPEIRACFCAKHIAAQLSHLEDTMPLFAKHSVKFAFVVNTGGAVVGTSGTERHSALTATGECIVFAERICQLARHLETGVLVLEPAHTAARTQVLCVPIDVVGNDQLRMTVFELRGEQGSAPALTQMKAYVEGFSQFIQCNFSHAGKLLSHCPDRHAKRLERFCQMYSVTKEQEGGPKYWRAAPSWSLHEYDLTDLAAKGTHPEFTELVENIDFLWSSHSADGSTNFSFSANPSSSSALISPPLLSPKQKAQYLTPFGAGGGRKGSRRPSFRPELALRSQLQNLAEKRADDGRSPQQLLNPHLLSPDSSVSNGFTFGTSEETMVRDSMWTSKTSMDSLGSRDSLSHSGISGRRALVGVPRSEPDTNSLDRTSSGHNSTALPSLLSPKAIEDEAETNAFKAFSPITPSKMSEEILDTKGKAWKVSDKVLGEGTFGRVFVGLGESGELVALKYLPLPEELLMTESTRKRPSFNSLGPNDPPMQPVNKNRFRKQVEAFISEVTLLSELHHENIVSYLGSGVSDQNLVVVMEYVSGGTLRSLLKQFGTLSTGVIKCYARDILMGLQYLHRKQLIHRDISPNNVLLTVDGRCKLTDFGASVTLQKLAGSVDIFGTPPFMAPEACVGHAVLASDIWSFGIIMCQMFSGSLPWPEEDLADAETFLRFVALREDYKPIIPVPYIRDELALRLITSCLDRDATKRPTADQLLLHAFLL
jgi:class 3 adenylate cyclase